MNRLDKTEAEARRLLLQLCAPEIAALIADDWETNPLTLEFLRLLRTPDGKRKITEIGLQHAADAAGVSSEEMLYLVCANPVASLECKLEHARIARDRGMPGVILMFEAPESHCAL
jgi:hypothetical protein